MNRFSVGWFVGITLLNLIGTAVLSWMGFAAAMCLAPWPRGEPCNDRDDYLMGLHSRNARRLRNAEDLQVSEEQTFLSTDTPVKMVRARLGMEVLSAPGFRQSAFVRGLVDLVDFIRSYV
jgi:hypothetical protein